MPKTRPLNRIELVELAKREATEARLLAKFGPKCFEFADLMDELDRKGITDIVLSPLANIGDTKP